LYHIYLCDQRDGSTYDIWLQLAQGFATVQYQVASLVVAVRSVVHLEEDQREEDLEADPLAAVQLPQVAFVEVEPVRVHMTTQQG
jgi:hypothetical protein